MDNVDYIITKKSYVDYKCSAVKPFKEVISILAPYLFLGALVIENIERKSDHTIITIDCLDQDYIAKILF